MGALMTALRRKYKDPRDVLRELGLPESLLDNDQGLAGIAGDSTRTTHMLKRNRTDPTTRRLLRAQLRRAAVAMDSTSARRLRGDADPRNNRGPVTVVHCLPRTSAMLRSRRPTAREQFCPPLADT